MNVFITSSPYLDGAGRAVINPENAFLDRLREVLPSCPSALFVCADPDAHELTCRFGADTAGAFADAGICFREYAILDGSNSEEAAELAAASDLIIFSGGHVPTQNAFLRDIDMKAILDGYEGTVIGISAGSMNLAETVYVQPEEEGEGTDPDFDHFAEGLCLTEVNILPHYQKVKHNELDGMRLFEDITYPDSFGHTFFALPDGSYFFQDENMLLLCGEAYLLRDGELSFLNGSGDVLDMASWEE